MRLYCIRSPGVLLTRVYCIRSPGVLLMRLYCIRSPGVLLTRVYCIRFSGQIILYIEPGLLRKVHYEYHGRVPILSIASDRHFSAASRSPSCRQSCLCLLLSLASLNRSNGTYDTPTGSPWKPVASLNT